MASIWVSDERNSRLDFQSALISAVAQVTHIAPSLPGETVLGYPVIGQGIVEYDNNAWHLCSTMTGRAVYHHNRSLSR